MGNNNNNQSRDMLKGEVPAIAEEVVPQVHVVNADPVIQFLDRKSEVSAQELYSLKSSKPGSRDILTGGDVVEVDATGLERTRPRTIRDVNSHLLYAWTSVESLRKSGTFSSGWFPAKATNDGGSNIPNHYFNKDGYIFRGESCLSWTTRDFYNQSIRDREQALLRSQVESIKADFIEGKPQGVSQQVSMV